MSNASPPGLQMGNRLHEISKLAVKDNPLDNLTRTAETIEVLPPNVQPNLRIAEPNAPAYLFSIATSELKKEFLGDILVLCLDSSFECLLDEMTNEFETGSLSEVDSMKLRIQQAHIKASNMSRLRMAYESGEATFYREGGELLGFTSNPSSLSLRVEAMHQSQLVPSRIELERFRGYVEDVGEGKATIVLTDSKGRRSYLECLESEIPEEVRVRHARFEYVVTKSEMTTTIQTRILPRRKITTEEAERIRDEARAAVGDDEPSDDT